MMSTQFFMASSMFSVIFYIFLSKTLLFVKFNGFKEFKNFFQESSAEFHESLWNVLKVYLAHR